VISAGVCSKPGCPERIVRYGRCEADSLADQGEADAARRRAMQKEQRGIGHWRWWREKQRVKRERTGPSAEAQQEQRNADKVVDPTVVAKNAGRMFPP
jgi:hypothetical protein